VNIGPGNVLSKIPVRICNLSARPVKIGPKTVYCNLKPAEVVRNLDPPEGSIPKDHNQDKSLEDLGINIPSNNLSS
jgi:hypothetical protein